ncbi:MAG: alpha-amylase family glycosyl hydrolase [Treponema sp.]
MQKNRSNCFFQNMEFHIHNDVRKKCRFKKSLFSSTGNVVIGNVNDIYAFTFQYNNAVAAGLFGLPVRPEQYLKAGQLNAMGLIDEIFHYVCRIYRCEKCSDFFSKGYAFVNDILKANSVPDIDTLLIEFCITFPPAAVYSGKKTVGQWFAECDPASGIENKYLAFEEFILCKLANENPAFAPFYPLFDDSELAENPGYAICWDAIRTWSLKNPVFSVEERDLISVLKAPVEYAPSSLKGQLEYIRTHWAALLGDMVLRLLTGADILTEEEKAAWADGKAGAHGGSSGAVDAYSFENLLQEYERFSADGEWMPNVVMMAKSTLVWLDQLSKKYKRSITRLDQIPDEELDFLAESGFNALWLIGVWERSKGSARIKQICGNPDAAASAYSLMDYEIAQEIGGWQAVADLKTRAQERGIRLAADMVPNHTGLDAHWVVERPDLFMQTRESPFPSYRFEGENLSHDPRVGVYLENHYYSKSDCAVVFKRVDHYTGDVRYIYHGNDGTGLPWNDTAQIDFLNPEAREAVIQKILHVARNFPIIRFDAAMVLAKKHIRRLWYPEHGQGGDIASRSRFALSTEEFHSKLPEEFWREVVDRCAAEAPDTLLLAEAFWMMEGYFVRTLGMHRVYNSAFMNMLKKEENAKYRLTIKNTLEFDPEILKRYVNFMNNPDEETAVVQFGKDDKYFGVCTMLVAMPGLPMFGHGQIEGFEEKYGMEYRRAYYDEQVNTGLVDRHRYQIFPLMKKRRLFSGVENFLLYDFWVNGSVNENVFAWSNRYHTERSLIFYNNKYEQTAGWIKVSAAFAVKDADGTKHLEQRTLAEGLQISGKPDYFVIMQEQRSKLWYVRESSSIAANGLFVALNGFETQVFLNMYEVCGSDAPHYRTLCENLQGNGIADISMALNEIKFKNIYTVLAAVISRTFLDSLFSLLHTIQQQESFAEQEKEILSFIAAQKEPVSAYLTALDTAYHAYVSMQPEYREQSIEPIPIKKLLDLYNERLYRLLLCASGIGKDKLADGLSPRDAAETVLFTDIFTHSQETIAAAVGALLLFPIEDIVTYYQSDISPALLCKYWNMGNKTADLLADAGIPLNDKRIILETAVYVFYTHPAQGEKKVNRTGMINRMANDAGIIALLDLHEWNNTQWFHRESAEVFSAAMTMLIFLYAAKPSRTAGRVDRTAKDAKKYQKILDELYTAIHTSEYRTDNFLKLFAGSKRKAANKKGSV